MYLYNYGISMIATDIKAVSTESIYVIEIKKPLLVTSKFDGYDEIKVQ